MFKDKEQLQQKILHLLVHNMEMVSLFLGYKIDPSDFDPGYRVLYYAVCYAHTKSTPLTVNSYADFVERAVNDGSYDKWTETKNNGPKLVSVKEKRTFVNVCDLSVVDKNDFDVLVRNFKEIVARAKTNDLLQKFQARSNNGDYFQALSELGDGAKDISTQGENEKYSFRFADDTSQEFMQKLRHDRLHPAEQLSTGYPEIDEAISMDPGSLNLFVADVGGFKSTLMLNVAINLYKQFGKDVLYVSLEMPEDMVKKKIVSRETNIRFSKIHKPSLLSDDEIERVDSEWHKWNTSNRFAIIDTKDQLNVSDIRSAIETYIRIFKPRAVFVDYITILAPEKHYAKMPSHEWVGFMCKGLRQMGRKHGFVVISAAQLGREALKRLKSQKEGSQTVGSEDVRGSHDFSADSDSIFALVPDPNQPNQKLQVFCIKSRYGDKTFSGKGKIKLDVKPEIGKILSATDATWGSSESAKDVAVKHGEAVAAKISFDDNLDIDDFDESPKKNNPKKNNTPNTGTFE